MNLVLQWQIYRHEEMFKNVIYVLPTSRLLF